jgi:hypothetical protein
VQIREKTEGADQLGHGHEGAVQRERAQGLEIQEGGYASLPARGIESVRGPGCGTSVMPERWAVAEGRQEGMNREGGGQVGAGWGQAEVDVGGEEGGREEGAEGV